MVIPLGFSITVVEGGGRAVKVLSTFSTRHAKAVFIRRRNSEVQEGSRWYLRVEEDEPKDRGGSTNFLAIGKLS